MKLTVFNAETMPRVYAVERNSQPRIAIGAKGMFTITKAAADLIGLAEGDLISFAQDDDGNWYIYKDDSGFKLRLHSDKKSLYITHKHMGNSIKESFSLKPEDLLRFLIAGQPTVHGKVKYWGLIIKQS